MHSIKFFGNFLIIVTAAVITLPTAAQQACDSEPAFLFGRPHHFEQDIQPMFDAHCVHCHQPDGEGHAATGLDLRQGHSWENLVGMTSAQDPEWLLVDPYDPERSLLWHKINCDQPPVGGRMPADAAPLDYQMSQLSFRAWILRGALPHPDAEPPPGAPVTPINAGMSGSWYHRETSGQGFIFDVVADRDPPLFLAYWFTYAEQDGGPESLRWYLGEGHFEEGDESVSLTFHRHTGGRFDDPEPEPTGEAVASALLTFNSCNEATFNYLIELEEDHFRQNEVELERLTPGTMCHLLRESEMPGTVD